MPASRLSICNQALSSIKAKTLQSLGENSFEARECNRFYPQIVSEMLEGGVGDHTFSFANRRVVLAETTNDRDHEWAYAYGVPADMGTAVRVIPDLEAFGLGIPVPLPGEPYAEMWASQLSTLEADYAIENGILYANVQNATLEYGISSIDAGLLPAQVVRAITSDLASRLAVPIKGDTKLETKRQQEADLFWQRAIADDKNRQPQQYGSYLSETMAARDGLIA